MIKAALFIWLSRPATAQSSSQVPISHPTLFVTMEMLLLLNDAPSADLVHEGTLCILSIHFRMCRTQECTLQGRHLEWTLQYAWGISIFGIAIKPKPTLGGPSFRGHRLSLGAKRLLGRKPELGHSQIRNMQELPCVLRVVYCRGQQTCTLLTDLLLSQGARKHLVLKRLSSAGVT